MTKIFHQGPKQPRRKRGMFGKANTFAASVREEGRYVSSKRAVERERDRGGEGGNTRTYRTPFVVRHVASCRRCKRWDERGVRGIVGVGKLKAEAPRCRSGQPTPRCFAQKKERRNKKKREESRVGNRVAERESAYARWNACFAWARSRFAILIRRQRDGDSHETFKRATYKRCVFVYIIN